MSFSFLGSCVHTHAHTHVCVCMHECLRACMADCVGRSNSLFLTVHFVIYPSVCSLQGLLYPQADLTISQTQTGCYWRRWIRDASGHCTLADFWRCTSDVGRD